MIYSLRGTVIHNQQDMAVIECGGVGYAVRASLSTLAKLPPIGQTTTVFTQMNVRQDAVELFGFADKEELNCFKMLTSVSGVGPKAALSILSDLSPQRFALCIATGDAKSLTKSQGIGNKIAQRIILELKDKIAKEQLAGVSDAGFDLPTAHTTTAEAVSALVVLGYPQSMASRAVSSLDPASTVEELIKQGLKLLAANL